MSDLKNVQALIRRIEMDACPGLGDLGDQCIASLDSLKYVLDCFERGEGEPVYFYQDPDDDPRNWREIPERTYEIHQTKDLYGHFRHRILHTRPQVSSQRGMSEGLALRPDKNIGTVGFVDYERIASRAIADIARVTELLGVSEKDAGRPIVDLVQEFLANLERGGVSEAKATIDRVVEDLESGFVACKRCGDQEDTATLDCMGDLKRLQSMLSNNCQPCKQQAEVPALTSVLINDCCWTFVKAMPYQLPGPIFNNLKRALYASILEYHEKVISGGSGVD